MNAYVRWQTIVSPPAHALKMFLQHINTLASIYLTKWINTGDKMIDNTITSIAVITLSTIAYYVSTNWIRLYNLAIFYLYGMYKNPLNINGTPYILRNSMFQYRSKTEFTEATRGAFMYITSHWINLTMKDRGLHSSISARDLYNILTQYIEENNTTCVRDIDSNRILVENMIVYTIGVSNRGSTVYLYQNSSDTTLISTGNNNDCIYIYNALQEYIIKQITSRRTIADNEIYVPTASKEGKPEMKSIGKINKKKTFDALFYPQKTELVRILEKFQKGQMYPVHIPMDNKLGILLYGPPGTGKTGTVSAVANMLQRSLCVINFAEIKTCQELDDIMDPTMYSKYVYVFDEFDCVLDVISGAAPRDKKEEVQDWGKMLLYAEGEERKSILEMMRQGRGRKGTAPIDLAYLLQKLDGLESAENRIIIATTNNPDRINPALMRPGRFDLKICLGLCTADMVVDILDNYYKGGREKIQRAGIPDGRYSPLQLINAAIQAPSMEKLLKQLA